MNRHGRKKAAVSAANADNGKWVRNEALKPAYMITEIHGGCKHEC